MNEENRSLLLKAVHATEVQFRAEQRVDPTNDDVIREFKRQCRDYQAGLGDPRILKAVEYSADSLRASLQRSTQPLHHAR